MFHYVRQRLTLFGAILTTVFAFHSAGCSIYSSSTANPAKAMDATQFFLLDENFSTDFVWRVDLEVLRQSGLQGKITRLPKEDAKKVAQGRPQMVEGSKSLYFVRLYLKNDHAQTLTDSTRITLAFSQVTRSEVHEYNPRKSNAGTFASGVLLVPAVLTAILAVACSCPNIYAENSDGVVFEGDVFTGATHPQLERHDWLPLPNLRPNGSIYRLHIINEDPEIQHINLLELMAVDHPAGVVVQYDKYGRLHALADPQGPVIATNLDGQDVRSAILKEDNDRFRGNPNTANPRAEDGLLLSFQRPPGARSAKLVVRGNTAPWLAYSHQLLQRDLGKYGPKVRQKFLEKDSAALQQWVLQQNMPLSVWLETAPGKWEMADFFHLVGPKAPRRDVLQLDLSKLTSDQVRIKLATGFQFWEVDYVALDFSSGPLLRNQVVPLASATDMEGRDLKELLRANDHQYYVQSNLGDEAVLDFPVPPIPANAERTFFLHAKGHYQILREPVEGRPSRAYLRQFTKADALPKYSRERWNEVFSHDTLWTASQNR